MAAVGLTIALPITELTFTAGNADEKDKFYNQRPKHFIQIMADSPVKVIPIEVFRNKFKEILRLTISLVEEDMYKLQQKQKNPAGIKEVLTKIKKENSMKYYCPTEFFDDPNDINKQSKWKYCYSTYYTDAYEHIANIKLPEIKTIEPSMFGKILNSQPKYTEDSIIEYDHIKDSCIFKLNNLLVLLRNKRNKTIKGEYDNTTIDTTIDTKPVSSGNDLYIGGNCNNPIGLVMLLIILLIICMCSAIIKGDVITIAVVIVIAWLTCSWYKSK